MHNCGEGVSSREENVGPGIAPRRKLRETEQIRRIEDASTDGTGPRQRTPREWLNAGEIRHARAVTRVRVMSPEVINAKLFVVTESKLADYGAQDHLRRFDVHFVEDFRHLHDDLT